METTRQTKSLPATKSAAAALTFHGRPWPLFRIFIVNLILTILTLGFYRFRGKTRIRRYLWSHTAFGDERLEYTGTAKQLFLGFLIAVFLVLIPLFGGVEGWRHYQEIGDPEDMGLSDSVEFAAVVYLIPVALYRTRRYRLSRSKWRGIGATQTGSSWLYGAMTLGSYVLTVLTLGLAWPFCSTRLMAYKINNTWLGGSRFSFTAKAAPLYPHFLAVLGVSLVCLLLPIMAVAVMAWPALALLMGEFSLANLQGLGHFLNTYFFLSFGIILLAVILSRLPWNWYKARELSYFTGQTRLRDLTFAADISGWNLLKLRIGNFFLLVLTLGLALPVVYVRICRFMASHLRVGNAARISAIVQNSKESSRTGEGLADVFDVGEF
ncbi:MAG: YjgN family protein [Rhodospirillales bacterium]|nr:YjgN family protein [Rhodospirillales bacterium]